MDFHGKVRQTGEYAMKIQRAGRGETFPLGTSNKTAAASKAKEIHLSAGERLAARKDGVIEKSRPLGNPIPEPLT